MRDSIAPRPWRPATGTAVVLAVGALTTLMALVATAPRASAAPAPARADSTCGSRSTERCARRRRLDRWRSQVIAPIAPIVLIALVMMS
ncbi:MAG TPA: hypothetical protein VE465_12160 [Streptosporangiaceae bacterium]|nr:hypothetical protein [Streptosporangiaceae bacterium]